ncbi:MAG: ornithine aminomutase subunit alpha [Spirochaetota bacterium]
MERSDDFELRREHLKNLTDEELKDRFWALAEKVVAPLLEEARTHTSPSIERSVLLRMGFSSIEAKAIVSLAMGKGVLGHGVGALVVKAAEREGVSIREAGLRMIEGRYWAL